GRRGQRDLEERGRAGKIGLRTTEDGFCLSSVLRHYSPLIFAARTTLLHFSVSSAMNLLKVAGGPVKISHPRSTKRLLVFSSLRPASISLLSLSMISGGVPFGATIPYQPFAS